MKKNIGPLDRTLRALIGIGAIVAAFVTGNHWFLLGIVPLLTALIGFCPAYCPLGINTGAKDGCGCGCDGKSCGK